MEKESHRETLERWLSDGETFIGIFENKELGSPDLGIRIAMSFDMSQWDLATIGTRAPDTLPFINWRYQLVFKTTDVDEALAALGHTETERKK